MIPSASVGSSSDDFGEQRCRQRQCCPAECLCGYTATEVRSEAMAYQGSEGPWLNSNLGALSFPSTSLSLLFPSLFLLFPSQPLPCHKAAPQIQLEGLGSAVISPSGVWSKSNLVHFSLKIRHLLATNLMIFLRVLPKIFLWPHYSGAPGAGGRGSLNRLNPRFLYATVQKLLASAAAVCKFFTT